ncbi:1,4-alpha-glucan branching protein GlgB [Diplocloster agilis]|uniref:1,4-alpha-glucan branching protein GlgB n=1 Tax=Diplocloster agilis TaxID=2850323 RepID=UPI000820D36B|nr:1,4-alpha-glucan branching protein GlgB [Suonthocola fibrivorans]MCU6733776.1 1,4-alpha-glucan branching protein GlgB [Suonthocola fibrivorans]SCJ08583.1 1%2C4-alpha-glucan branching enzyme GlgB [uncultured Clostridium sp.]
MDKTLYDLMDWAAIEAIVYSEEDNPHNTLGPHVVEDGVLVQTFIPTAEKVTVKLKNNDSEYPMEQADEEGFFAVLLPRKSVPEYTYVVTYDNGTVQEIGDPYRFAPQFTEKETKKFNAGILYQIYEKMGAHPMNIKGTDGVYFSVWAPNAMRVSVVGDFNLWDGRRHQMRRLWDSGIFELFIPNLEAGQLYKFEIKTRTGLVVLKADPYANAAELRPNTASVVTDLNHFTWKDDKWLEKRKKADTFKEPMFIYEMHLGSWRKPEDGRDFYNYRELAPMVAEYVKDMGYTHIELMPVMEHPLDASWGYQVTGYYAPTSRYGTPEDFMFFMDYMHEQNIGVILDWVPAHFPRDTWGMSNFDGTCLYEHADPRKGSHPHWGTLIYNYERPEVKNFLISNALFWIDKFHADGIRIDAVASMLYLDYGKNEGEWVPNIYGGHENLEAVELFKHLNSVIKGKKSGAVMIAEESTSWPMVTGDVEEDGLGFDYKWNMGWMNDFIGYMRYDPIFRGAHHGELTFSMIYAYSENFILTLSHDEVVHGKGSMIGKMPGDREAKFANLRAAYGFMMTHPGKKLLFMGQDMAQFSEWSEEKSLEWNLLEYEDHAHMKNYVKALVNLYRTYPALYQLDYDPKGFTWINNISANENMLVFTRNTKKAEETLLVVCNFSALEYEDHKIGVPYAGKYKEIFNSDSTQFGGTGAVNSRLKQSRKDECDDRPNSIKIRVAPLSISIFTYTKAVEKISTNKAAKSKSSKAAAPAAKKDLKAELAAKFVEEELSAADPVLELPKKKSAKAETKKAQPEKAVPETVELKKVETKKVEPKKVETKKVEPKKVETKKVEPKKVENKKVESKKVETKKAESKKVETKKVEPKKVETKKVEPKKVETKKTEPKKVEAKNAEAALEKSTNEDIK